MKRIDSSSTGEVPGDTMEANVSVSSPARADQNSKGFTDSEEDEAPVCRPKRRVQRFSDSDSDEASENETEDKNKNNLASQHSTISPALGGPENSDEDVSDMEIFTHESRSRKGSAGSDGTDSDNAKSQVSDPQCVKTSKNSMSHMLHKSDSNDSDENQSEDKTKVDLASQDYFNSGKGSQSPPPSSKNSDGEDDSDMEIFKHKSRLRKVSASSDSSDSDNAKSLASDLQGASLSQNSVTPESRISSKRNKLRDKFKTLLTKRSMDNKLKSTSDNDSPADESNSVSLNSGDEFSSGKKIKQKIKEQTMQISSSICDPDTSDEESHMVQEMNTIKKQRKTKPTSPKRIRMSAKQAMENMQKIRSESNRMLREKDVSLPYHRPKALSLKDILSKRRPAVSADGKALPIKMNEQQLREYTQQLEQRQKEVIELCKSESEEEIDEPEYCEASKAEGDKESKEESENNKLTEALNDTLYDEMPKKDNLVENNIDGSLTEVTSEPKDCEANIAEGEKEESENDKQIEALNDTIYDEMPKTDNLTEITSDEPAKTQNLTDNQAMNVDEDPLNNNVENQLQLGENSPMPTDGNGIEQNKSYTEPETLDIIDKNNSADMELVYNDSVETDTAFIGRPVDVTVPAENVHDKPKPNTETDSQLISLHYDNTEKTEYDSDNTVQVENIGKDANDLENKESSIAENDDNDDFPEEDLCMDDIDALIENAEITASQNVTNNVNSPMLIKEPDLSAKPKLTGAPGMVIDLDGTDPLIPRKLTGVELLKERFVFFANLKTPEELERERENKLKPGAHHLKQELENHIAEQRSLEWTKRLEEEKQRKEDSTGKEITSDAEEDIDEVDAKLEEKEQEGGTEESTSAESEVEEDDQEIVDKPRKRNPMVDDEAEESDCDDIPDDQQAEENEHVDLGNEADEESCNDGDDDDETEESSDESEEEQEDKPAKKGRILKAFDDSDEECPEPALVKAYDVAKTDAVNVNQEVYENKVLKETQDDVIQLAQKSLSEDLFTSQDSKTTKSSKVDLSNTQGDGNFEDKDLATQTFSILETNAKDNIDIDLSITDKFSMPCESQSYDDNLDAVVGMCSGSFSQTQNLVPPSQMTDAPSSQAIGENILALCTGQFYDNQFVSQDDTEKADHTLTDKAETIRIDTAGSPKNAQDLNDDTSKSIEISDNTDKTHEYKEQEANKELNTHKKTAEDPTLKSILDELNDPQFDSPKPNKYFLSEADGKENKSSAANAQFKKKFVIDSDDEENAEALSSKKMKKNKKRKKMEERALQISDDDEDEESEIEDEEMEVEEEIESDVAREEDGQLVEYDSDENEILVAPKNPKKMRKVGKFFENEAELTSEDEWVGSGDEDEAGLDRMEREEGDDDTFNENKLQRELGQIHMRDVLDQDKREVRMIQELLFEDGDLGGGSRQRKFRWKDVDGDDETGPVVDEFGNTQEDEAESEEQWRKERHEREMYIRSLNNPDEKEKSIDISMYRTSMIKANLSKDTSSSFIEVNTSIEVESPVPEKKTAKDIPSPKKPFIIFQQNYHGSLLTRGQGALARLAALATPLANDDDAPRGNLAPTNKRNFVFAAIDDTDNADKPKVTKRKAEASIGTPRLMKRMRAEEKQKHDKISFLDHLKV